MMSRILYVIASGLGTIIMHSGCATESKNIAHEGGRAGAACGNNVCTGKTYCCTSSCGICAPIGGFCTQQACLTPDTSSTSQTDTEVSTPGAQEDRSTGPASSRQCGPTTCSGDTQCCNPSCGICVPPGGVCTQQFCGTPELR
jgi:hypothetical protein